MISRTRGFTLIELLVVIAIIAVLAAVLFPILTGAKAQALKTSCAENMRQMTVALLDYAEDYDGTLPGLLALGHAFDPNPGELNRGPLWDYLRTKEVYSCPADPLHKKKSQINYTYTMNGWMTHAIENRDEADYIGLKLNIASRPTRAILLVDENTDARKNDISIVNDFLFIWMDRTCDRHPGCDGVYRVINGRRIEVEGVANVTYVDSHVGDVPGLLRWNDDEELFHSGISR